MIEVTCLLRNSLITLDFSDKQGRLITNFGYGQVLNEENCNAEDLKRSMENGILKGLIDGKFAIAKKINVKGAITGTPVPFNNITGTQEAIIASKKEEVQATTVEEPKTEETKVEPSLAEVIGKRKYKKVQSEEVKPIAEVKNVEIKSIEDIDKEEKPATAEEPKKTEDDFV